MVSLATAEQSGAALLSKLDVKSIADARKLPAEVLLKAGGPGLGGTWPNFDGYVLLGDQYNLYKAGRYNDTPVLIGWNADEGALFVRTTTESGYLASVHSGYGEYADKILSVYPGDSDAGALRSARDMARDTLFGWGTWSWARLQSQTGKAKVFVYYFSHRPPYPDTPQFKDWGAAHGSELSYVFENFSSTMSPSAADKASGGPGLFLLGELREDRRPKRLGLAGMARVYGRRPAGDESRRSVARNPDAESRKAASARRLLRLAPQPSRRKPLIAQRL